MGPAVGARGWRTQTPGGRTPRLPRQAAALADNTEGGARSFGDPVPDDMRRCVQRLEVREKHSTGRSAPVVAPSRANLDPVSRIATPCQYAPHVAAERGTLLVRPASALGT